MKRTMAMCLALLLGIQSYAMGVPAVDGYTVRIYASAPKAYKMAFDPSGVLYTGRGGDDPWGPHPIHRIGVGGGAAEPYGPSLWDPDAVAVDVHGAIADTAGSVLVGGQHNKIWYNDYLYAIRPDQSGTMIWPPGTTVMSNPQELEFDATGQTLVILDPTGQIRTSTGGATPTTLVSSVGGEAYAMTVDSSGRIFVARADGVIRAYGPDGSWLDQDIATGLGLLHCLAFGKGGYWGNDLYTIGNESLLRFNVGNGTSSVIGTGFDSLYRDIAFGPDGNMYISDYTAGQILQVVVPEPLTMLGALLGVGSLGAYLRKRHST